MATVTHHLVDWGGARLAKSVPWIGAVIALATIVGTMRRKGVLRGGVDTALNALPYVGTLKNVGEMVRGRDYIADRPLRSLPR
jgi:hypothetical protein